MLRALEHIRRMRGGAQSHLLRCSDGGYYIVKFQNNPQHPRILVNELLGSKLAARMGLPVPPVAVVEVPEELIRYTADLVMQLGQTSVPCRAGLQFASRYPGDPRRLTLHDFLPDEQLQSVGNLGDFAGMLVYDKWTCNTNGRQAIFLRDSEREPYRALMIDQGFCFNAGEWNFPDAPLRGLYARQRVYEGVTGMESFAPWLERLETRLTPGVFDEFSKQIPPEWYGDDQGELYRLLEALDRRRSRVRELLVEAKRSTRQPFPNWS
ncbi:MAG TPA: HipA family kinase [Candidatus Acidoferrales bacterium]|nr:HipA family kinase [Candidatus Acidoferrales bacterium]